MTARRVVATEGAPAALGVYSQAIVAAGLVHCSGQIALDPVTGEMVGKDAPAQAERALENLKAVLEAAGSDLGRVLKCNLYLADMADFAAVNEVYGRYFGTETPPARACVAVKTLPKNALFEVDCIALVD
jgi:2-iminobutanoate/2-iminopropanoate deaminase